MKIPAPARVLSLLIALLATGALLVSGCGDDDGGGGGSADAKALLNQAFSEDANKKQQDGDVKVALGANLDGGSSQLQQPLRLEFGGPVKSRGENELPELDWDFKAEGLGQAINGGLVVTSDNAFVSYGGRDYEVGESDFRQFKSESESEAEKPNAPKSLRDLGIDPNEFLTDLKQEDGEPVGDIQTERVTGTVDTEKLIRSFLKVFENPAVKDQLRGQPPPELSDDDIKQVKDAVEGVDFYVDIDKKEKVVRRLNATVDFKVPEEVSSNLQGLKGGKFTFSIEVGKLAPGTNITAPSGARPIRELSQQLGRGLLGGLGGGSTGGAAPTLPQQ